MRITGAISANSFSTSPGIGWIDIDTECWSALRKEFCPQVCQCHDSGRSIFVYIVDIPGVPQQKSERASLRGQRYSFVVLDNRRGASRLRNVNPGSVGAVHLRRETCPTRAMAAAGVAHLSSLQQAQQQQMQMQQHHIQMQQPDSTRPAGSSGSYPAELSG